MKFFKFLLVLGIFCVVAWLSINTLVAEKILAKNPITLSGVPKSSWGDVGDAIQSGLQSTTPPKVTFDNNWLSSSWQGAQQQLGALVSNTGIVTQHVQNIVGDKPIIGVANPSGAPAPTASTTTSSTTPTPSPSPTSRISPTPEPFYSKALDYSKYVYCQEVVRDYEQQHPEMKK